MPQYNLFKIYFSVQDQYFASEYNKKIKAKGKIVVVDADYSPTFDEWIIRINSIPSEFKKVVCDQLTSRALPELRRRLEDLKTQRERFWFKVAFSLETGEIEICR